MLTAALATIEVADRLAAVAADLRKEKGKPSRRAGVTGPVLLDRDTPYGRIVIGTAAKNHYDCNQIAVIVDPRR